MRAPGEPIHGGMADELASQIASCSLPRQLAADLHLAEAQVVERHHNDQPPGVLPQ
jgi:hypothetical protein